MLGLIFTIAISFWGITVKDKRNILLSLVFILPLNDFLKNFFDIVGGGTIFSFWKELLILILFIRCKFRSHIGKIVYLWEFCVIFYFVYFLVGSYFFGPVSAFRTYRWLVIVPILMLSLSTLEFDKEWLKRIITLLCFSSLLISFSGIIEIHCGCRLPIRMWMGNVVSVSPDYIEYNVPNFLMHNYDRMCGVMTVPNNFGNLMAIMCLVSYFAIKNHIYPMNGGTKYFIYFCFFIFFVCLIESFCRTGWAQLLIGIMGIEYLRNNKSFIKYFLSIISIVFLTIVIVASVNDMFREILEKTLTGNDESSATRGENVLAGMDFMLQHFIGIGLGGCDISNDNIQYFTESSCMNVCIESGLLGGGVFYYFCLLLIITLKRKNELLPALGCISLTLYVVSSLPSVSFNAPYGYIIWILVGLGFSYNDKEKKKLVIKNSVIK